MLQKCVQELAAKNFSLLTECQKLSKVSKLSEKLISELEHENLEQQVQVNSLFDQVKMLRTRMYHVSRAFDIDAEHRAANQVIKMMQAETSRPISFWRHSKDNRISLQQKKIKSWEIKLRPNQILYNVLVSLVSE